jgi:non-homologous end joining protein Ku
MLSMIIDKRTVTFDPSKYRSEYVANMRKLTGESINEVAVVAPAKSTLVEMLAAMAV